MRSIRENVHSTGHSTSPGVRSWYGAVTRSRAPVLGEPASIELVNTCCIARGGAPADALRTTRDVAAWLSRVADRLPVGLAAAAASEVGDDDVGRARVLRDALASLLRSAADSTPLSAAAVAAVNGTASAGPGWLELDVVVGGSPQRVRHSSAPAPAAVLSVLAQKAVELLGASAPVRACASACCCW